MADNLREKLPTKNSIIAVEDKVILSQDGGNTTVDEFGRITFNEENFPTIFLDTTTDRVASLSSYIETTTVDKLTSFETPEILALQYKHSSNAEGDVIGIAGHAVTDINFEEHVNTIDPIDLAGGLQISKNAATKTIRDRRLASSDILLSPGVYRVECTGTFTLVGIAGGLDDNGNVFGNGYKSYVVLELHKETQPGEILLYSTPAVEYSSEKNINDSTSSVTCYMYGYISICNPSVLKLKAKTAGEYAIGTVDPDSAGDFPDTFINPVQIVFEKVCDDPFCMEVSSSENDVFPGFTPFETTTLPPVIPPPPPLIPGEDPTVTTTTTTLFPPGGGAPSAPPPPGSSGGGDPGDAKPARLSDTINCGSVGFCTSSPYLRGFPKWGYLKSNGEYQRTTTEQAGWSWFNLLDKDPGTVVDRDYNSRVIFEGGKRRHNGGIMGKKPGPGDAIIFKTFEAPVEYYFSELASKDRGECDYCREESAIGDPAPTSLDKLVVNKWKHSREEWCHLTLSSVTAPSGSDCPPGTSWTGDWTSTGPSSWLMGPGDSLYLDEPSNLRFPGDKANPKFWDKVCKTPEEEIEEDLDPGEDKCAVTLAWPCFVHDFGTAGITEGDMKSGEYEGKEITRTADGQSVYPKRVAIELGEIFGDVSNVISRSVAVLERGKLIDQIESAGWFSGSAKDSFASYNKMKENYVNFMYGRYEFAGLSEAQARNKAGDDFEILQADDKLLWRTENGDADDDSEDIAVIFEDKILPLLQIIQNNPPVSYKGIYTNQNILKIFSSHLRTINKGTPSHTTVTSAQEDDFIDIFTTSALTDTQKGDNVSPYSKFYELAIFIAHTKYYETIINVRPAGGGYAGIEQWVNARDTIPSNIYFNKWWKSKVFDNMAQDLNSNIFKDLIAGPGKEPEEYRTGNCCMTKNAMIIEAYYWNLDQFKNTEDQEYKFIPWWFRFKRSQVDDGSGSKEKTHKYVQEGIDKYSWIKQPVDLLGIIDHPHPYADTAEATITQKGEFVLGCQD